MTEQAKPTTAELAEIKAAADRMSGYWPATATILLAEVERLQGEVRRLREALEQYANERLWHHRDQWIGRGRGWDLAQEALDSKEAQG